MTDKVKRRSGNRGSSNPPSHASASVRGDYARQVARPDVGNVAKSLLGPEGTPHQAPAAHRGITARALVRHPEFGRELDRLLQAANQPQPNGAAQ